MAQRSEILNRIRNNIYNNGYHVTLVTGGELPRFAYTIGCKETIGSEFLFAGGEFYSKTDVSRIISEIVLLAKNEIDWQKLSINIDSLGYFSLAQADKSWSEQMTLGVFDYYNQTDITVWQILPDGNHRSLDVPNTSQKFDTTSQPIWKWLSQKWDFPVPNSSMAVTNLKVLFGEKATEVMRWEQDEWEIFSGAGPDIPDENKLMVPLGLLIGIDNSLERTVHLDVGKGLWRDNIEFEWNDWG